MKPKFLSLTLAALLAVSLIGITIYAKESDSNNKKTFYIKNLEKGDLMLWDVCSRCSNTFSVTIRDDDTIYKDIYKDTYKKEVDVLSYGSAHYKGGKNLRIEVEFDDSSVDLKKAQASSAIKNEDNKTIGYIYTYNLEDANDEDYNDAVITLKSWKEHK